MTARTHRSRVSTTVALLLLGACSGDAPTTPAARPDPGIAATQLYLSELLDLMRRNALRSNAVNWDSLREQVRASSAGASTVAQAIPAIRIALTVLGDGHSSYTSASGAIVFVPTRTCTAPPVTVPTTPSDIGYVRVRGFSGSQAQALALADSLQLAIRDQDLSGTRTGWIVDLRGNTGGNMWPMVAGIGPILGEGVAGAFIDANGRTEQWGYNGSGSYLASTVITSVTQPHRLRQPAPRVAVLIDNRVGSSGEATAIAFKERPDTRFFGSATCGLSTANQAYFLSDGAILNLTTAVMADRTGRAYGAQVAPDEALPADSVVPRALAWLRTGR